LVKWRMAFMGSTLPMMILLLWTSSGNSWSLMAGLQEVFIQQWTECVQSEGSMWKYKYKYLKLKVCNI
jgi:hypothetical protein